MGGLELLPMASYSLEIITEQHSRKIDTLCDHWARIFDEPQYNIRVQLYLYGASLVDVFCCRDTYLASAIGSVISAARTPALYRTVSSLEKDLVKSFLQMPLSLSTYAVK